MSPTGEYEAWLVQIEGVRLLRETDTRIPMVRVTVNTFEPDVEHRKVSFYMPRGPERPVIGEFCERFGVERIFDLKGRWATMICPADDGRVISLQPTPDSGSTDPVMVTSFKEALRISRDRETEKSSWAPVC